MLSQTEGTLQEPFDVGPFTDRDHYRMAVPDDAIDVYGLLHLFSSRSGTGKVVGEKNAAQDHLVFAFTSCLRFVGRFILTPHSLDVEVDLEGMRIAPGQSGVRSAPPNAAIHQTYPLRCLSSASLPALPLHADNVTRSGSGAGRPGIAVRTCRAWH